MLSYRLAQIQEPHLDISSKDLVGSRHLENDEDFSCPLPRLSSTDQVVHHRCRVLELVDAVNISQHRRRSRTQHHPRDQVVDDVRIPCMKVFDISPPRRDSKQILRALSVVVQ